MIFLIDAIKISIERILVSFLNILLFRNTYGLCKEWLNGTIAFILTIYLMGKARSIIFEILIKLKHKLWPKRIEIDSFSNENLKSIDFDSEDLNEGQTKERFTQYVEKSGRNNLFRFVKSF